MDKDFLIKFNKLQTEQQLVLFVHANLSSKTSTFISSAREKLYSVGMTDQTYRVIGSWVEYGLLDDSQDGSKWKKFSLLDLLWIKIIDRLRDFGYPIRSIEKVMRSLFYAPNNRLLYKLDFALWQVSTFKKDIALIVSVDGETFLGETAEIDSLRDEDGIKDYIQIDFSAIVKELTTKPLDNQINKSLSELPINEIELLDIINSNKYSHIEITLRSGRIEVIKASENIDVNEKVVNLLRDGTFQDITIKQTNGKVVSVKRTTTKKL
ncbi:MAG: MerR family transcriptional regulator [Candidatus Roizmanbacteria bacterium]